ncbi:MAG: YkvA family protein [Sandaracinaceae bacterium]
MEVALPGDADGLVRLLTSSEVPQANRADRVLELVQRRVRGVALEPEALGWHRRDVRYYAHAASLLGLLDAAGQPTPAAQQVAEAETPLAALARCFADSPLARAWVDYAQTPLASLDPATAEAFLAARSELAPSTAKRRAATLRSWHDTLAPLLRPTEARTLRAPVKQAALRLEAHPMDDIPADARALFARSAEHLDPDQVAALRQALRDHLDEIRAAAQSNELLPLDIAQEIAEKCDALLRGHAGLPPEHGALVVAAARYFISSDDARPDLQGVLGLDDDAAVFNHAARQIGRGDLVIDV